jgi:hypothetical protein
MTGHVFQRDRALLGIVLEAPKCRMNSIVVTVRMENTPSRFFRFIQKTGILKWAGMKLACRM